MTIKEVLERIDPVFFMEQKVWIQNQIAELGPSGLEKEAEGILHLLDNLQDVAEEEFNIELGLSETDEVTEYCSKCDREITLPWNVRKDGLKKHSVRIAEMYSCYVLIVQQQILKAQ